MGTKFVISDPKAKKAYQKEVAEEKMSGLIGLKLGAEFDAGIIDLPGYHLKITGGSDKSGFPIKPGVSGSNTKRLLLTRSTGFQESGKGLRRRKIVRGTDIGTHLAQINTVVVKSGKQKLDEILGKTEEKKA